MEKICFIVCQYGAEVNGGAEIHCKMLAEHLSPYFKVEIITTKIINYNTFEEYYSSDEEDIDGIRVLRFPCKTFDNKLHRKNLRKAKWPRKIRRFLFRLGILKILANVKPIWNLGYKKEIEVLKSHGYYSPEMLSFLKKESPKYKAMIFMSYPYPHTILGAQIAPEKSIIIPTVHNESDIFRSVQTHLFTSSYHIAFNTVEEKEFAYRIFGNKIAPNSIIAVGVNTESKEDEILEKEILSKYNIASNYIHYFGRICYSKMENLVSWFTDYKKRNPSNLKLVLTGRLFQEKVQHPDIIYTGFVTDQEKISLIKHADLIINPSKNESLSLLLLEAMNLGKMVLVNGQSDVMRGHCERSGFAADYYLSRQDFESKLHHYVSNKDLRLKNSRKAKKYVDAYYDWNNIIKKLKHTINKI